jgi:hypothetical protein
MASRTRERNFWRGVGYTMAVMAVTVVMVLFILPSVLGRFTRRPEGAAYRFLHAVSAEEEGDIAEYGTAGLVRNLTNFERHDEDDDWFERVEVGKGLRVSDDVARVPVLVVWQDAESSSDRRKVASTAVIQREAQGSPRDWRVIGIVARDADTLVPSEGGKHPARASAPVWVGAFVIGIALTAGASALLRAIDRGARATPARALG